MARYALVLLPMDTGSHALPGCCPDFALPFIKVITTQDVLGRVSFTLQTSNVFLILLQYMIQKKSGHVEWCSSECGESVRLDAEF